jgi:hypothetical protein
VKKFEEWVDDLAKPSPVMVRILTEEADAERADFIEYGRGCSCHTGCAPCSHCTHPGNPMNQEEDESAWRMVQEDQVP